MKKHRIFNKGDYVYCLLTSHTKPNVQIPIKGIIIDTQWDPVNPKYKIRILKFYDTMRFLNENFFDMNFHHSFKKRAKTIGLKKEDFTNVQVLEKRLNDSDREKFYLIIDSIMCTKTKVQLEELFKRVQFYLISKNLKEVKMIATRPFFKGPFSVDSKKEFDIRIKRSWKDNFEDHDIDIDKYLDSLS